MKDIWLFGATSILGWALTKQNPETIRPFCNMHARHPQCDGWDRINLEEEEAYQKLFQVEHPKLLIHCGGICDVDRCEDHPDWAHDLNVNGMRWLLRWLPKEARLVYVSSDHVFGGGPGKFLESSSPQPISVYGRTRVKAENLVRYRPNSLIIRVGLPIGQSIDQKTGHLNWLQYRKSKGLPLTIVDGEVRSAVWADDCAKRVMALSQSNLTGIRHVTAQKAISRKELATVLNVKYNIGATFELKPKDKQPYPHLGRVELGTEFNDSLSEPLSPVDN